MCMTKSELEKKVEEIRKYKAMIEEASNIEKALEAEIKKTAEAKKYAEQQDADAKLYATQKASEAELFERMKKAEAEKIEAEKQAEAEKAANELAKKKKCLSEYAARSGYISTEEIESSEEIKKLIDAVDENGIKAIIVDRLMAQKNDVVVETSEATTPVTTEVASLTCDEVSIETSDYKSVMKKFLGK